MHLLLSCHLIERTDCIYATVVKVTGTCTGVMLDG